MTRAEFSARTRAYERRWLRIGLALFALLLLVAVAGPMILGLSFWTALESERPIRAAWSLCLAAFGVLIFAFVFWYSRVTARQCGLTCPACQATLNRRAVRLAGKCGKCGSEVISDFRS